MVKIPHEDTEKLFFEIKKNIPTVASKVSSVEETPPPAPPQNQPSRPDDGRELPALQTKNAVKQVVATMMAQQKAGIKLHK